MSNLLVDAADGERVYLEDRDQHVWFTNAWRREPVFHRRAEYVSAPDVVLDDGWLLKSWSVSTLCGQLVAGATWEATAGKPYGYRKHQDLDRGHSLPLKHVILFGRPCKKCWP